MGKAGRRISIGIGILLAVLLLIAGAIRLFFDVNDYKPQIEAAVTKATGLRLVIGGDASLKIFPRVQVSLRDVRLTNRGGELFAANEVRVAPQIVPFLRRREVIVDQVLLFSPKFRIEKDAQGRMNYETAKTDETKEKMRREAAERRGLSPGQIGTLRVRNGEVAYIDRKSGKRSQINGLNLDLADIAWRGQGSQSQANENLIQSVIFKGKVQAQAVQAGTFNASDLKADIRGDRGLVFLHSTEAVVFGGNMLGEARIDLRSPVPKIKVAQSSSHVDLQQALPNAKDRVSGVVSAAIDLAAAGQSMPALAKTANGDVTVRGNMITLTGIDADALASNLKLPQSMDLVEIGSALLTGPLAPALGQAAGVSSGSSNAKTVIQKLVADWDVANGIATAKDVAFSTEKNTIAFKGGLNLITKTYENFYVATVDPQGCAKNKVQIVGQFAHPRPNLESLGEQAAEPYLDKARAAAEAEARKQVSGLLGRVLGQGEPTPTPEPQRAPSSTETSAAPAKCDQFYSGSIRKTAGG